MSDLPPGCPLELVRSKKSILPKRRKILLDTRWPDWTSLWLPLAFLRRWTNIRLYFWSFKSRSQAFKAVIPQNIWTKKMSCRQFLERGCPQPSGSPPFPGSASIRQVISSTQDNTLPHTEAKATFFRHLPMQRSAPVRSSSQGQGNFRRWSSRNHQVSLHEGDDSNIDPGSQRQYKNF